MIKFQKLYEANKKLDDIYNNQFSLSKKDLVRKNKLELLVEIGELANETKCFKYWTTKKPNFDLIKIEYADCLIMTLCFFNYLDVSLEENFIISKIRYDETDLFANLYKLASEFYYNEDKELIKTIFVNLLELGKLLNITDEEIIATSLNKIDINTKRLLEK